MGESCLARLRTQLRFCKWWTSTVPNWLQWHFWISDGSLRYPGCSIWSVLSLSCDVLLQSPCCAGPWPWGETCGSACGSLSTAGAYQHRSNNSSCVPPILPSWRAKDCARMYGGIYCCICFLRVPTRKMDTWCRFRQYFILQAQSITLHLLGYAEKGLKTPACIARLDRFPSLASHETQGRRIYSDRLLVRTCATTQRSAHSSHSIASVVRS